MRAILYAIVLIHQNVKCLEMNHQAVVWNETEKMQHFYKYVVCQEFESWHVLGHVKNKRCGQLNDFCK